MADIEHLDDGYGVRPAQADAAAGPGLGALVNWAGALISLGLVVGMGIWAFQLMMRDVSGVPVIQAIEGPMRVPPADPGGTQAPHQGLAVNRIAEGEEAQPVPDRLVLAPPPVQLQPVRFELAVEAEAEPAPPVVEQAAAEEPAEEAAPDTAALIDRLLREAQAGAPSEESGEGADEPAVELAAAEPAPRPLEVAAETPAVIPASIPGVARSLRPSRRPVSLVMGEGSASFAAAPAETVEIPVSDLPEGTRLVQLGAFDSPEVARGEWERLSGLFPDYFAGRPRVIEQASSGGQTFFRLRAAGFDDLAGSRRFCAVLVAQGAACIPVTVR